MPFQSRAAWTTRPNRAVATKKRQRHLTWHYPGFGTDSIKTASWSHSRCLSQIDTWEKQHQARGSKNTEYNLFACSHGYLIEGRGNRQNGANGTSAANRAGMSCQVLIGDNEPLTAGHRSAMREAVAWAEGKHPGMTSTQYGHRHWVGTRCPGPYVMAEIPVRAGVSVPAPGASVPAPPKGDPSKPWTTSPRVVGMSTAEVKAIQTELVDAGYSVGSYGVDGSYGDGTGTAVKQLQTDLDLTADGVWGPTTQEALMTLKNDIAKLQKDVTRLIAFSEQIHWRADAKIPALIEGVSTKADRLLAYGEQIHWRVDARLPQQINGAQAAAVKAIQETGKAQGLTDAQVQQIAAAAAEAAARVSAEDVADGSRSPRRATADPTTSQPQAVRT